MKIKTIGLGTTVLASLALSGLASAQPSTDHQQDSQAARAGQIDEIIITARRRAETLSTVPVAVSAFDAETLRTKQITDTSSLSKIAPGLNFSNAGTRSSPIFSIRGQTRATAGGGTPGVMVYQNDVSLPTYGTHVPTFDMANVQVLKGPQGTLFGRNAVGGAILLNTAEPTHEFGGYVEGSYGRYDSRGAEGAINIPIIEDVLSLRLAGQAQVEGSYTDTVYYTPYTQDENGVSTPGVPTGRGPAADRFETDALRLSVLFEPTSSVRNVTVADWTRLQGGANAFPTALLSEGIRGGAPAIIFLPPPVLTAALGPVLGGNIANLVQCPSGDIGCNLSAAFDAAQANKRTNYRDTHAAVDIELWGVSNTTTIDLTENLTVKNILGYRSIESKAAADLDGTAVPILSTTAKNDFRILSEELQLSGNLTDRLQFVLGGFYYKSEPDGDGGNESFNAIAYAGLANSTQGTYVEETSKAIYGQVDYDFSWVLEGLSLTAGYRYSWDEARGCVANIDYSPFGGGERPGTLNYLPGYSHCRAGDFSGAPPFFLSPTGVPMGTIGTTANNYKVSFEEGTYTLSVNWQMNPDTLVYVAHRTGYRAGGFNYSNVPAPFDPSLQFFEPETVSDFELGLKTRWSIGEVQGRFDAAAYTVKDEGYQYPQATTGICVPPANSPCLPTSNLIMNKADLEINGFELGADLFYGGLSLGADVAYNEIKIDKVTIPQGIIDAYEIAGQAPPLETAISSQPEWQANASLGYEVSEDIFGGRLSFHMNLHHQVKYQVNEVTVPGYTNVDGQIALENLGGRPVDLRFYVRNMFDERWYSGTSSSSTIGVLALLTAPPRTFGMSLRYRFGDQ